MENWEVLCHFLRIDSYENQPDTTFGRYGVQKREELKKRSSSQQNSAAVEKMLKRIEENKKIEANR